MIRLDRVTKTIRARRRRKLTVLSAVSLEMASQRRIALLGPAADEKAIVIDLLAGVILPTSGRVVRDCKVSFPVGFLGGFNPELSVRLNVAHTAQLYGVDPRATVEFVSRTADMGPAFEKPFAELVNQMRRQLGFVLTLALPFDVYLLKGDLSRLKSGASSNFRAVAYELFEARAQSSGIIVATSNPAFVREYCDSAMVLSNGQLALFDDVDEALAVQDEIRRHQAEAVAAL